MVRMAATPQFGMNEATRAGTRRGCFGWRLLLGRSTAWVSQQVGRRDATWVFWAQKAVGAWLMMNEATYRSLEHDVGILGAGGRWDATCDKQDSRLVRGTRRVGTRFGMDKAIRRSLEHEWAFWVIVAGTRDAMGSRSITGTRHAVLWV